MPIEEVVKKEPVWLDGCVEIPEEAIEEMEDLYKDHKIKEELVLCPELTVKPPEISEAQKMESDYKVKLELLKEEPCEELACKQENAEDSNNEPLAHLENSGKVYLSDDKSNNKSFKGQKGQRLKSKQKKERYNCIYCTEKFQNKKGLTRHERTHDQKTYSCDICEKRFKCLDYMNKHIKRVHTKERLYKCHFCTKRFKVKSVLTEHMRTHPKTFECDLCGKAFWTKKRVATHIHKTHSYWKCDICSKQFEVKRKLIQHLRYHMYSEPKAPQIILYWEKLIANENKLTCNLCQKIFYQHSNLANHMLRHTGERPFKCELCEKTFMSKQNLESHLYIHTGKKLFSCSFCQKEFTQKSSLIYHEKEHTGDLSFACVCGKKFAKKWRLDAHSLVHTKERPLQCNICETRFKCTTSLGRHMQMHAG